MVKVKALQSMFSLICWVFFPPQFPQQRQQQKHRPDMKKPKAISPPMMVTTSSPTHQVANCNRRKCHSGGGGHMNGGVVMCGDLVEGLGVAMKGEWSRKLTLRRVPCRSKLALSTVLSVVQSGPSGKRSHGSPLVDNASRIWSIVINGHCI